MSRSDEFARGKEWLRSPRVPGGGSIAGIIVDFNVVLFVGRGEADKHFVSLEFLAVEFKLLLLI